MTRFLVILLAVGVLLAQASIPVANGRPMSCKDRVVTKYLGCGACTTSDILKVTGLSFFDFVLLQNGHIGNSYAPIYPSTVIDADAEICVAGYFT